MYAATIVSLLVGNIIQHATQKGKRMSGNIYQHGRSCAQNQKNHYHIAKKISTGILAASLSVVMLGSMAPAQADSEQPTPAVNNATPNNQQYPLIVSANKKLVKNDQHISNEEAEQLKNQIKKKTPTSMVKIRSKV